MKLHGLQAQIHKLSREPRGSLVCDLEFSETVIGNVHVDSFKKLIFQIASVDSEQIGNGWLEETDLVVRYKRRVDSDKIDIQFMLGDLILVERTVSISSLKSDLNEISSIPVS